MYKAKKPSAINYDSKRYLEFVVDAIERRGWLSRGKAYEDHMEGSATADFAQTNMGLASLGQWNINHPEAAIEEVELALNWARTELDPGTDDYLLSLKLVVLKDTVNQNDIGTLASLSPAYRRELAKRKEAEEAKLNPSTHIGKPNDKITARVTVKEVRPMSGYYGDTYIHKMLDENGNVLTWFCTGSPLEKDQVVTITGTVKSHGEFKGIKETVLTRVKALQTV